ncbi:hypothetical protein [Flavobacterium cerinum]|uniref:Bacterial Pleckstrin homology domain-containing protein n=1 Tax=Flavobacterium cerinum TaxID=2502784 RepID=A0A3S3U0Z0_9FLAO|nr:hypothetical protein [Flavobacterium cerinum]RWX00858.1 hypothetical protein EPI11_07500 [Flavobacterium cerinum]
MENYLVFTENQHFGIILYLILLGLCAVVGYCIWSFKPNPEQPTGNRIAKGILYLVFFVIVGALVSTFFMSLNTKIDNNAVYVKFAPFESEWRSYPWDAIKKCELKTYDPIKDYGGWGIRDGAYNASGDQGLLLTFNDGSQLMIGTQKPEKLKKILQKLNKLNI